MSSDETGLAWWIRDGATPCWLAVEHGRVIRGTPWLVQRLFGAGSNLVEAEAAKAGATIWWTPLSVPPRPFQTYLTAHRRIRRWVHQGEEHLAPYTLIFGEAPGGWYAADSRIEAALLCASVQDAWAICQALLAHGGWVRTPANYGPDMAPAAEPPLPDGLDEPA